MTFHSGNLTNFLVAKSFPPENTVWNQMNTKKFFDIRHLLNMQNFVFWKLSHLLIFNETSSHVIGSHIILHYVRLLSISSQLLQHNINFQQSTITNFIWRVWKRFLDSSHWIYFLKGFWNFPFSYKEFQFGISDPTN